MKLFRLIVLLLVSLALPVYGLAGVHAPHRGHCLQLPAGAVQAGVHPTHAHTQHAADPAMADGAPLPFADCCGDAAAAAGTGACPDGPGCHAAHYLAPVTLPAAVDAVPDRPPVSSAKALPTDATVAGLWRPPRPL